MHPLLHEAVEDLYTAFERPHPDRMTGCPCCTQPAKLDVLVRTPLRQLSVEQLRSYAAKAMTTVGDTDAFRYFWPRLAELSVTHSPSKYFVNVEVLLGKPAYGEWRRWPAAEQQATERFAAATILRLRDEVPAADDVDGWVCAAGQLLEDVTPLLDAALLADTPAANENLRAFYEWNQRDVVKRHSLHNAFWRRTPPGAREPEMLPSAERVVAWFQREDVLTAIDRVYV
jgi:hypothetical protein